MPTDKVRMMNHLGFKYGGMNSVFPFCNYPYRYPSCRYKRRSSISCDESKFVLNMFKQEFLSYSHTDVDHE